MTIDQMPWSDDRTDVDDYQDNDSHPYEDPTVENSVPRSPPPKKRKKSFIQQDHSQPVDQRGVLESSFVIFPADHLHNAWENQDKLQKRVEILEDEKKKFEEENKKLMEVIEGLMVALVAIMPIPRSKVRT
ncbi:hypothetical protein DDE82_008826 [Stemphylium lycopersici]|uniref:Uncharacterized protein n=1 Tax=Stemphylium lycopersici TaxID=183478 RepID=A0A364MSP1_STELY|nr:hypothetical protein DDE82_008826 [Stemphylium lycopersici]RAR02282.1 hypothetical protein DDE83_008620 [Stemphylium lycopersici]